MAITNAQLAQQVSELLDYWRTRDLQFAEWLSGSPTGGPYGDGRYPLSDYLGVIQYLFCPAALESGVTSSGSSAALSAALAGSSKDQALLAQTAAVAAQNQALAHRDDARAARDLALQYRNEAANSMSMAATHRNKAREWASKDVDVVVESGLYSARHYAIKTSELLAGIADDVEQSTMNATLALGYKNDAEDSAADAAASALAAQTWNPANYIARAGSTMTGGLIIGDGTSALTTLTISNNAAIAGTEHIVVNNAVDGTHESTMLDLRRNNISIGGLSITNSRMIANGSVWVYRGEIHTRGQGRFTGWYNSLSANEEGLGAEVGVSSGIAHLLSYNRASAVYGPLALQGTSISLDANATGPTGSPVLRIANNRAEFKRDVWHADSAGAERLYLGSAISYYKSAAAGGGTAFAHEFRDAADGTMAAITQNGEVWAGSGFRWYGNSGFYFYNTAGYSYGSWRIGGARNGYVGLVLDDGRQMTLMSNGAASGIYNQALGYWDYYNDGGNFRIGRRPYQDYEGSGGALFRMVNGQTGGRVWIQQGGSPQGSQEGDLTLIW